MKKKLVCLSIVLFLISHEKSVNAQISKVYSEWSLQCRQSGEYIYEDKGVLRFGKAPSDDRYLWISESTESENVKIRNKRTGHYLLSGAGGRVVCANLSNNVKPERAIWLFKGFGIRQMANCSWYTLSNFSEKEGELLTQIGSGAGLNKTDRNTNYRSHWTLVREKGSLLPFAIFPDSVVEASFLGLRESKAVSITSIQSDYHEKGGQWKLKENIGLFPQFTAENNTMMVALYNMALEEMQLDIRSDSTFMAGALWPDTWTRDAVYSIYFAFSWIQKDISRRTLRKQTLKKPKEALQDTGTGGSWPISTDRVVWAMAAWEYYLVTGDKAWLAEAYEGLSYTAIKDIHVTFDKTVNLFRGETCSMDWRTHTYPNWFSNENIGESFSSGTNALHLFLYDFLARSGKLLNKKNEEIDVWEWYYKKVKKGINDHFWDEKKGLYYSYLYPQFMNYQPSSRVDIMSNGLAACLGAASLKQVSGIVENYPLYPYGGAVIYPTIADDFAYHNKSVWTVWETPYLYAAKRVKNLAAVSHIMKSQIRQGAMFLTHKENMTYDTGYDRNTALNSDRQLWSVASYISMVYRVLFGMEMTETGLLFSPVVPSDLVKGELNLKNFKYRNSVLDIKVTGTGSLVKNIRVNGKVQSLPFEFPASSKGKFTIEVEVSPDNNDNRKINLVQAGPGKCWAPDEPVLNLEKGRLIWRSKPGLRYKIYGNNSKEDATSPYSLANKPEGYYSVSAVNDKGLESDLSNPILYSSTVIRFESEEGKYLTNTADTARGYSGKGYVVDFAAKPANLEFTVDLAENGNYSFSLIGSNGRGPHDVYCFVRSVFIDGKDAGTFILESSGSWNKWTMSNQLILKELPKGEHSIKLLYNPENKGFDNNMSFAGTYKNDAYIDYLRVVKLP